jgi:Arc/MetJ-type ribon-helix-helix transcriptional regulator
MKKSRVSEAAPIQVYLGTSERSRLDRLAVHLATTKSEIVRRALAALEREVLDPSRHPALALIGLAAVERLDDGADAARDHDRLLGEAEEQSWRLGATSPPKPRKPRRGR